MEKEEMHRLLNINEAAEYLGIKPTTLANWLSTKRRVITSIKIGALRKFRKKDLDAFIESCKDDGQKKSKLSNIIIGYPEREDLMKKLLEEHDKPIGN